MTLAKLDYNMSPWKKTITAGLISYIDAGSIVAGAAGLSMWQAYFGMDSMQMGILAALSSNTGGAAIGSLIGGKICDKYGRKFVYNYALLIYMIGVALIVCATNYPMFLLGYVFVGVCYCWSHGRSGCCCILDVYCGRGSVGESGETLWFRSDCLDAWPCCGICWVDTAEFDVWTIR